MKELVSIDGVHEILAGTQKRLALEKIAVCQLLPLSGAFDLEAYGAAYVHAEQQSLKAIKKQLNTLNWLPLRLDPEAEMLIDNHASMKRFIKSGTQIQPTSADFGNDFVHVLTRAALTYGWNDIRTAQILKRIAVLFRELSCLVAIVYFSSFLVDREITEIELTDPDNLEQIARDFATLLLPPPKPRRMAPAPEQQQKPPTGKTRKGRNKPPFLQVVDGDKDSEEPEKAE